MDDTQMDDTNQDDRSDEDLEVSYSSTCPCTTCAAQRRARAAAEDEADTNQPEYVDDSTKSEGEE
eukprot:7432984-Heterocapsa_arctica.AAC.1